MRSNNPPEVLSLLSQFHCFAFFFRLVCSLVKIHRHTVLGAPFCRSFYTKICPAESFSSFPFLRKRHVNKIREGRGEREETRFDTFLFLEDFSSPFLAFASFLKYFSQVVPPEITFFTTTRILRRRRVVWRCFLVLPFAAEKVFTV